MQLESTNLSTMPRALAEAALEQNPDNPMILRDCKGATCGYYQYLQGTSMASPHATGVAALIVSTHGARTRATAGSPCRPAPSSGS
jgi:lantibiotic leader peptide-processing serine protease